MAGAGYKLFTTGSVLTAADVNTYLAEQTVMVFANATARTTALSGVVSEGMISYLKDTNAVEVYDGSNWVSSDDPNAIQNTIVDAKGDLIAASAADTPARLAVGNNGETLVADSSATTGLRWTATPAASNPVINGAFDIWQRGTSFSIAASTAASSSTYTADRWQAGATAANQAVTISRQVTGDTTNLPNIQYCIRYQRNSGQTGTSGVYIAQSFESVNAIPFAGKTVTFSFYARAGANFSASSNLLVSQLYYGTGTDQNAFGTYTGGTLAINSSNTLTTTWQRFTATATLPTTVTEFAIYFGYTPTGTASTNDYYEVTGVQIDIGNTALPFRRAMNTLAGELAACQRYYYRETADTTYAYFGFGMATLTTSAKISIPAPVTMRVVPTSIDSPTASTLRFTDGITGTACNASPTLDTDCTNEMLTFNVNVASGLTQYRPVWFGANNSSSAYIGFSAEL